MIGVTYAAVPLYRMFCQVSTTAVPYALHPMSYASCHVPHALSVVNDTGSFWRRGVEMPSSHLSVCDLWSQRGNNQGLRLQG